MISLVGSIRSKTRQTRCSGARRWFVLPMLLLIAAACSADTSGQPSTPTASGPIGGSISTPAPSADSLTEIDGAVVGAVDAPSYTVDVPDGWSAPGGLFVVKTVPGVLGLSVWDVGEVTRDPCHWKGRSYDPGPTVDDLVEALMAQRTRHATDPIQVSLDDHKGRYLEWSVPADMEVTGDADFTGCDVEPSNGHLDFVSWYGAASGDRYQQVAGQVDMLWVLDVDGQRLVVDATYSPDIIKADRGELVDIVESLRFTDQAG
jgi:hypothetical protein